MCVFCVCVLARVRVRASFDKGFYYGRIDMTVEGLRFNYTDHNLSLCYFGLYSLVSRRVKPLRV